MNTQNKTTKKNVEENAMKRPQASPPKLEAKLRSQGKAAGRHFVSTDESADASCLDRLEKANSGQFEEFYDLATVLCGDDDGVSRSFEEYAWDCGDEGRQGDFREQFEKLYGGQIEERAWLEGFVHGAVEKYHKLKTEFIFPLILLRASLTQHGFLEVQVSPAPGEDCGYNVKMRQATNVGLDAAGVKRQLREIVAQIPASATRAITWRVEACAAVVSGADVDAELEVAHVELR